MPAISTVNKILFAITIVLILAIGGLLYWQMSPRTPDYYAVMTASGDLFFGEFHSTNRGFYLTNVWTVQRDPNDNKSPATLVKFSQSDLGPEDKLELNPENIIWKAKLRADSQVLSRITNPSYLKEVQPSTQQLPTLPTQQNLGK